VRAWSFEAQHLVTIALVQEHSHECLRTRGQQHQVWSWLKSAPLERGLSTTEMRLILLKNSEVAARSFQ
jgi:hypothetical protein